MDASPLGRIARELRNQIYQLVLQCRDDVDIGTDGKVWLMPWKHECFSLSLLKTCRQVYEEAKSIVYAVNDFRIHNRDLQWWALFKTADRVNSIWGYEIQARSTLERLHNFERNIGTANMKNVRSVEVETMGVMTRIDLDLMPAWRSMMSVFLRDLTSWTKTRSRTRFHLTIAIEVFTEYTVFVGVDDHIHIDFQDPKQSLDKSFMEFVANGTAEDERITAACPELVLLKECVDEWKEIFATQQ